MENNFKTSATRRRNLLVPRETYEEWKKGGASRARLQETFAQLNFDKVCWGMFLSTCSLKVSIWNMFLGSMVFTCFVKEGHQRVMNPGSFHCPCDVGSRRTPKYDNNCSCWVGIWRECEMVCTWVRPLMLHIANVSSYIVWLLLILLLFVKNAPQHDYMFADIDAALLRARIKAVKEYCEKHEGLTKWLGLQKVLA